jgi:hypothetical protein
MCLFSVCAVLCLGRGLATSWSLVQGVLPIVNRSGNWKAARAHKGYRAIQKRYVRVNVTKKPTWRWQSCAETYHRMQQLHLLERASCWQERSKCCPQILLFLILHLRGLKCLIILLSEAIFGALLSLFGRVVFAIRWFIILSTKAWNGPYLQLVKSTPCPHIVSSRSVLILSFQLLLDLTSNRPGHSSGG